MWIYELRKSNNLLISYILADSGILLLVLNFQILDISNSLLLRLMSSKPHMYSFLYLL